MTADILHRRLDDLVAHLRDAVTDGGRELARPRVQWNHDPGDGWPRLLPMPFTVGDAFKALADHGPAMVERLAADVATCAAAFEADADTCAAFWPWPRADVATYKGDPAPWWPTDETRAAALALRHLRGIAGGDLADDSRWPLRPRIDPAEVADACAPTLDRLHPAPALPDKVVADWEWVARAGAEVDGWRDNWHAAHPAGGDRLRAELAGDGQPIRTVTRFVADAEVTWPALVAITLASMDPGELVRRTLDAWATRDPAPAHYLVAAARLRDANANADDPVARGAPARDALARALADELRKLAGDARAGAACKAAVKRLREIGKKGAELAGKWTDDAQWRLCRMGEPMAGAAVHFAAALWVDCIEPRLRAHRPALARAVATTAMLPAMTHDLACLPGMDDGLVRDKRGKELGKIATVDAAALDAVRRGLRLLGTVPGHRLVQYLVLQVHEQCAAEVPDPFALRVEFAGWSGLATALRHKTRDNEPLKALLQAGQHVQWTIPYARGGGLWTWAEYDGPGKWPRPLTITVGDLLAPGYADNMRALADKNTARAARLARRLVPELRGEPPVSVLRRNEHGAAWTLRRLLVLELVDHAEDLCRNGAIRMTPDRWRVLASQAGVPLDSLPRLLDLWREGESGEAPALIVTPEPGRVALADPHAAESAFIAEGGRRRLVGRANALALKRRKADRS